MLQIILTMLVSVSATAFEGQPKNIKTMTGINSKVQLQLPEVSLSDLEEQRSDCERNECKKVVKITSELKSCVSEDTCYLLEKVWVSFNKGGSIKLPFAAEVMYFSEVETNNRLVVSTVGAETVCFGNGASRNLCTKYITVDHY